VNIQVGDILTLDTLSKLVGGGGDSWGCPVSGDISIYFTLLNLSIQRRGFENSKIFS
jgi:hypothetical protein